jgi:hypothetical protein
MDLLKSVIERSYHIIEAAEQTGNKDVLIDHSTLHLANYIDIQAAKSWIDEECEARKILPQSIQKVFGENVTETSLATMIRAFAASQNDRVIFVDDDFEHWEYEDTDHCWKGQFFSAFAPYGQQTSFCIAENVGQSMPRPILQAVDSLKGWTRKVLHIKNPFAENHLYPLAYIDGRLFFTNNSAHISMNDKWGNGTIYYIRTDNLIMNAEEVNTKLEEETNIIFKLSDGDPTIIKSSKLGEIIYGKAKPIIDSFVEHCKANADKVLTVSYQDEHLKGILGILFSLQTISYFIKMMGNECSLEFKVEQYAAEKGKKDSITLNQPTSEDRDVLLNSMAKAMVEDLQYDNDIKGTLIPIESRPKRSLTHWRVLTLECSGKRLCIYPDGGFINGWMIYNAPEDKHHTYYDISTITYDTEIDLCRNQEIKYDVCIEDVKTK